MDRSQRKHPILPTKAAREALNSFLRRGKLIHFTTSDEITFLPYFSVCRSQKFIIGCDIALVALVGFAEGGEKPLVFDLALERVLELPPMMILKRGDAVSPDKLSEMLEVSPDGSYKLNC